MTTGRPTPPPSDFAALVALAQKHHGAGQLAAAEAAWRAVLAAQPAYAEAHNNLGNVLLRTGRLDEARASYERALALKPNLAPAHNELGCVDQAQGRLAAAATRFQQAIALRPEFPEAYNNLGNVLKAQGHFDAAVAQFERAVALRPSFLPALINLGSILWQQGKLEPARVRFEQAIALEPSYAEAHHNLGNVLRDQGRLDAAAAAFERAIALKPSLFQAHNNLGSIRRQQGDMAAAAAAFRSALAENSRYPEAYNNLAKLLYEQGNQAEAAALYDQALAVRPDHAESHYNRAHIKTFRPGDPDLAALESLAADPTRLPPGKMLFAHFALGKALDDVGEHARAFEQWLTANALKRREVQYDEARQQLNCRWIAELFDRRLLDRFAGQGDPSPLPIFVLGMPRSGSTLVEQILASHPQVQAAGELPNLDRLVHSLTDAAGRPIDFGTWIESLDAEALRNLGRAYLDSLPRAAAGKTRIVDKNPSNFLRIGLIRLILPEAKIIHTVRDPVDTCLSCFGRLFADVPYSYDLGELGRYYRTYHELMAHWRAVLPAGVMLDVAYEDVVDDLAGQARRLIEFVGLPWDDRCLSFHETSRPIATASTLEVRRPVYRTSLARWRRYEKFLGPLLAELQPCLPPEDNS
ncbi:MAG TPA: tetratricopeptide repeat protein [Pirellulales bacterium]|nr:tetratricopeptide repeat protein [Pirellulales bacterium]